ncbi:hypothetical protein DFJ77DRAFT_442792 [Powellomyces hirtus]|nr:hypothetical protein DFJ77DRAFT_442792 [Powellomyces hirtus]
MAIITSVTVPRTPSWRLPHQAGGMPLSRMVQRPRNPTFHNNNIVEHPDALSLTTADAVATTETVVESDQQTVAELQSQHEQLQATITVAPVSAPPTPPTPAPTPAEAASTGTHALVCQHPQCDREFETRGSLGSHKGHHTRKSNQLAAASPAMNPAATEATGTHALVCQHPQCGREFETRGSLGSHKGHHTRKSNQLAAIAAVAASTA